MKDDRTPELLISVAKRVFAKKGFAGTTIREIAKEADVNLSLVSYHFDGKEGLYRACIEQYTQARLNDTQRVLQTPNSQEEFRLRFHLFISEFLRAYAEEPEVSLMVQREIENEGPIIADIFSKTLLKVAQTLKDYFIHAKERGWVRANLEPQVAMATTFGSMVHSMRMARVTEKFFHVSLLQPAYREMFCLQLSMIILDGISNVSADAVVETAAVLTTGTATTHSQELQDKTNERLQP